MNDDLNLVVGIDIQKSANNIEGQFAQLEKSINKKLKIDAEIGNLNELSREFNTQMEKMEKSVQEFRNAYKKVVNSLDNEQIISTTSSAKSEKNLTNLQGKLKDLRKDIVDLTRSSGGTGEGIFSVTEFRDANGELDKLNTSFKDINGIAKTLKYSVDELGNLELFGDMKIDKTEAEMEKISQTILKVNESGSKAKVLFDSGIFTEATKESMVSVEKFDQLTRALEDQTISAKDAESVLKQYNNEMKEAIQVEQERVKIIGQLDRMLGQLDESSHNDQFKVDAEAIKSLVKTADSMDKVKVAMISLDAVKFDFNELVNENKLTATTRKIQDNFDKIEEVARKFGREDWIDGSKFVDDLEKIEDGTIRSTKTINDTLKKSQVELDQIMKEYKQSLRMSNYGEIDKNGDAGKITSLVKAGDIEELRRYISQMSGMTAETIKLDQVMTNAGIPLTQLKVGFASTGKEMKKITYTIDDTANGISQLRTGFTELDYNANRNLNTFQHFLVSLKRIPAYLASAYLFDGIREGMQWVVRDILQVESELVEIQRVISDGINIDELFTGSVEIADKLGNSMHDVLNAVGELARTYGEFNEEQLLAVGNTATLMSNVSELGVEESISSLVATMKAFNIEAQDSVRIVDAFNEVDNAYAISTTQIASAMNKSAATAKTFNVSMEENIGNITAIGSVTMESGEIIGNSLKTLYSRITTLPDAEKILSGVGVAVNEIGESGEQVRPVTDILNDLAGKWKYLSDAERQHIGVTIAGRNQLSRFLALMNNYDTATEATTTAIESQGSAMRENQAYLDSYEAKINRMKTAFSGLAQSMGNAFLKSGLNLAIEGITGLTKGVSNLIDTFGLLPVTAGTLTLLFSKTQKLSPVIKGVSESLMFMASSFKDVKKGARTAQGVIEQFSYLAGSTATKALAGFKTAMVTAFSTTLVTGGIMLIAWGIEKLVNKFQEAREEAKRVEEMNEKMISSYRNSGDELAKMSDRYAELYAQYGEFNDAVNSGALNPDIDTADYEEYSSLVKKLSDQLPTVIEYTDAEGVAHLKTAEAVKQQVQYAKELSKTQAELTMKTINEDMAESANKATDAFKKLNQVRKEGLEIDEASVADTFSNDESPIWEKLTKFYTNQYEGGNWLDWLTGMGQMKDKQAELAVTEEGLAKAKQRNMLQEMEARQKVQNSIADQLTVVKEYGTAYMEAEGHIENLGETSKNMVQEFGQSNSQYLDEIVDMYDNVSDLDERAQKQSDEMERRSIKLAKASAHMSELMNKALEDGIGNLDLSGSMSENEQAVDTFKASFESLLTDIPANMVMFDETTESLSVSMQNLLSHTDVLTEVKQGISDGTLSYNEARDAIDGYGLSNQEADQYIRNLADSTGNVKLQTELWATTVDETTQSVNDLRDATLETIDAFGALTGVSGANITAITGYHDAIKQAKNIYGDNYKETTLYQEAIEALAVAHGKDTATIEKNYDAYSTWGEAIGAVKSVTDEAGNTTLEYVGATGKAGEASDKAWAMAKERGMEYADALDIVLGLAPDIEQAFSEIKTLDFTNEKDELAQLTLEFLTLERGTKQFNDVIENLNPSPEMDGVKVMIESFQSQLESGEGNWENFRAKLSEHLDAPQVDAIIQALEQVWGVQEETQAQHEATKNKLAEPLLVEVKPVGTLETEEKLKGIGLKTNELNGSTAEIGFKADDSNAQEVMNALVTRAIEVGMTEAEIHASVEGAETGQEQLNQLGGKIGEVEGKGKTASDILSQIGNNLDTSGANTKIADTQTKLDGLSAKVGSETQLIYDQIAGMAGAFNDLDLGIGRIENLGTLLGNLSTNTTNARNTTLEAVAMINTNLLSVGDNGSSAITSMTNLVSAFSNLKVAIMASQSTLSGFASSGMIIANTFRTIGSSILASKSNVSAFTASIMIATSATNTASSASRTLTQAKMTEAQAFMIARSTISATGSEYTNLANRASSSATIITSNTKRLLSGIVALSTAYKVKVGEIKQVFSTMSSTIAGRTSAMIGKHSEQARAINKITDSAKRAKTAVSDMNSKIGSVMGSMSQFISRAQKTRTQADSTRKAVERLRQANANNGVVGAIRNFVGLSTDRLVSAINDSKSRQSAISMVSPSTQGISANAGESTSVGYAGGTSGTIKPSFSLSSAVGYDGQMTFSASAKQKEEKEDPYQIDKYSRKYSAIETALAKVNGQMEKLNENTGAYRAGLQNTIKLENQRLSLVNQELNAEKSTLKSIEAKLKKLPAVSKQNVAQRKTYNELQKQYDDTLGNIASLTKEQQTLSNSVIENTHAQFESLINEIVATYDKAVNKIQANLDGIDFKLEVLEYTDPENTSQQTKLLVERQKELMKQESHLKNMQNALQSQYNSAVKKYGANDDRTLFAKEQLDDTIKNLRDATLEVLSTEKEIKDIRSDLADDSIDKLKDYYGSMSDMAQSAIKAEQDALEKAYEKREKLYDKEIEKIESVYDAKLKSIDEEEAKAEYAEQMAELETQRATLQKQIVSASRDTSLVGKKNLIDLQNQLAELNKEISEAQSDRQKELLKEQLEAERDAQVKAVEDKQTADEEGLNAKLEGLDKQSEDIQSYYDNILDDEAFWDKMQNDVVNGKFGGLIKELEGMYSNIAKMNNGVFDGLLVEFSSFSSEAQKEFKKLNGTLVDNLAYSGGNNSLSDAKKLSGVGTSTGNTSQKALGTPDYLGKWSTYSADNVLESSGTAPAPPKPAPAKKGAPAKQVKPSVGGTYSVKKDLPAYYTSDDAKARRDRRGTVKKGNYWIYNISKGMINVSNKKGYMGSWINPSDNKGGLTTSGSVVASSLETSNPEIESGSRSGSASDSNRRSASQSGVNLLSALSGESMSLSGAGGTSGVIKASSEETEITAQVKNIMPISNVSMPTKALGEVMNVDNSTNVHYDVNIPIQNFGGTKRDTEGLLKEFEKALEKKGK